MTGSARPDDKLRARFAGPNRTFGNPCAFIGWVRSAKMGIRVSRCQTADAFEQHPPSLKLQRANPPEPQPRDAAPRSAFRIVSRRRPSMSRDVRLLA